MARGQESSDYNSIVTLFTTKSTKSKRKTASKERGRDERRDVRVGEEGPNLYKIEY